jgi:hypothetical protein
MACKPRDYSPGLCDIEDQLSESGRPFHSCLRIVGRSFVFFQPLLTLGASLQRTAEFLPFATTWFAEILSIGFKGAAAWVAAFHFRTGLLIWTSTGGVTPALDFHPTASTLLSTLQRGARQLFFPAAFSANAADFSQTWVADWALIGRGTGFLAFRTA